MQPFDLLGITIKSLAEIEKEVSKPSGEGRAGLGHRLHTGVSRVPLGIHSKTGTGGGVPFSSEKNTFVSPKCVS